MIYLAVNLIHFAQVTFVSVHLFRLPYPSIHSATENDTYINKG